MEMQPRHAGFCVEWDEEEERRIPVLYIDEEPIFALSPEDAAKLALNLVVAIAKSVMPDDVQRQIKAANYFAELFKRLVPTVERSELEKVVRAGIPPHVFEGGNA